MKTLLGIRTVYDIDPTKTFRIADILEVGAILPHSVPLSEVMLEDLEQPEQCRCLEYAGDDPKCPVHGRKETEPKCSICGDTGVAGQTWSHPEGELCMCCEKGSDTSAMTQLQDAGYGSQGVF